MDASYCRTWLLFCSLWIWTTELFMASGILWVLEWLHLTIILPRFGNWYSNDLIVSSLLFNCSLRKIILYCNCVMIYSGLFMETPLAMEFSISKWVYFSKTRFKFFCYIVFKCNQFPWLAKFITTFTAIKTLT